MKKLCDLLVCLLVFASAVADISSQEKIPDDVQGYWEQEGYGHVTEISENEIKLYDLCQVSCVLNQHYTWAEVKNLIEFVEITPNSFTMQQGLNRYHYNRLETIPELCTSPDIAKKDDYQHNFESLWHTFQEQYCYFDRRDINWQSYHDKYIDQITPQMSKLDFFILIEVMLEEMDDGHVGIMTPPELEKAYQKQRSRERKARRKAKGIKKRSINVDRVLSDLRTFYMDDMQVYNAGIVNWGLVNSQVGMVQINGMGNLANYGAPGQSERQFEKAFSKGSEESEDYIQDEIDGAHHIMQRIVNEFSGTKACIIDLRFNGGGMDEVALALLSHFATKDGEVFTKRAYLNPGYTDDNVVTLQRAEETYQGQVFILTSPFSASATEIFVMSAIALLPDAIRIGSATEGAFSDILEKKLPNGWDYGLSNEVYETVNGKNYEHSGIPPHHEIAYPEVGFDFVEMLKKGLSAGDPAVEQALKIVRGKE